MHSGGWHLVSRDKLSHFPLELRLNDCKISYGRPWGCLPSSQHFLHVSVRSPHMPYHPCQCRRRAVILMEAECYFILPLVTAVSSCRGGGEREREGLLRASLTHRLNLPTCVMTPQPCGFIRRFLIHDVVFQNTGNPDCFVNAVDGSRFLGLLLWRGSNFLPSS